MRETPGLARRRFLRTVPLAIVGWLAIGACTPRLPWFERAASRPVIAYFASESSSSPLQQGYTAAFLQGLKELGYVEGETITIQWQYLSDRPGESVDRLAAELAASGVQVIVTSSTPALVAMAHASQRIPIISAGPSRGLQDLGLVDRDAHPGGNVTGVGGYRLDGKAVDLFKQAVPSMVRLAYLRNPDTPGTLPQMALAKDAALQLNIEFLELQARSPADIGPAFDSAVQAGADALMVSADTIFSRGLPDAPVVQLPLQLHLPTFYTQVAAYIAAGGLMGFSPDFVATHRRAAAYVDKILKGADPATLPVEEAMTFEFAINLKTAQAIGLTIPDDVQLRATQLIR
jgi:putative ABC transport system substrate-binding protein